MSKFWAADSDESSSDSSSDDSSSSSDSSVANNKAGDNRWVMDSDSGTSSMFVIIVVWLYILWVELCIYCICRCAVYGVGRTM